MPSIAMLSRQRRPEKGVRQALLPEHRELRVPHRLALALAKADWRGDNVPGMESDLGARLARNMKQLREARGLTQQQMAKICGLPRATWAHLESGEANPTLSVMHRAASALQVTLEELISAPSAGCRVYPKGALPVRTPGQATVRKLLPDPIPGMEMERIELAPRGRMTGIPHTPGTREYLTCETGQLALVVSGERWTLEPGDVVVFRGDQRHSYMNPGDRPAIGYSVVILARGA
jgi:XRE family transcriptional regulator, regulator of sulfur utilization